MIVLVIILIVIVVIVICDKRDRQSLTRDRVSRDPPIAVRVTR